MLRSAILKSALLLLSASLLAQSTQQPAPAQDKSKQSKTTATGKQTTTKPRPVVPQATITGFELAPRGSSSTSGGTQIGAGTRGVGTPTKLLAPYKGRAYSLTPFFQWSNSNSSIAEYKFRLMDAEGNVVFEDRVKGTSFQYPAEAPALTPGGDYTWTAGPSNGLQGEAAEPAEIVIAADTDRSAVEMALNAARTPQDRAKVFAEKGLWYDAIGTYSDLIKANPQDAAARRERAALYEQLPQTREAAKGK